MQQVIFITFKFDISKSKSKRKGCDNMIKMYTTHCPKCNVLKTKLQITNIEYQEISDTSEMEDLGIDTVPMLEVDGNLMNFMQAITWINERKRGEKNEYSIKG